MFWAPWLREKSRFWSVQSTLKRIVTTLRFVAGLKDEKKHPAGDAARAG
jgi:hypothetical protein